MTARRNPWRRTLVAAVLAGWAAASRAGGRGQDASVEAPTLPASVIPAQPKGVLHSHDPAWAGVPGAEAPQPEEWSELDETPAAPSPKTVAGASELQSIREFLSAIPKIRIAVPDAPGNGHQAVGATIAKRVRQLGFDGQYELIYPSEVKPKLDVTFQGFDPEGPDVQYLPSLGGTAVEESQRSRMSRDEVPLAISAADGFLSGLMNADIHISVEPFRWFTPQVQSGDERLTPRHLAESLLQFPVVAPGDLGAFVEQQLSGSARMREKIAGMKELAQRLDEVELLPAYGLSNWRWRLATLLDAVAKAQDRAPEKFKAGVVVCMFSHFKDDALDEQLSQLPKETRERLSVAAVRRPGDVERELSQLKPGRILLLRVGGVSQDLFEYIFSRQTLPGTVAGANAQNMMRVLGLPFLGGQEHGDGEVARQMTDKADRRLLEAAELAFDARPGDDPHAGQTVADFILAAKDPSSGLSKGFWESRPREPGDDKIAALLALAIARRRAVEDRRAAKAQLEAGVAVPAPW